MKRVATFVLLFGILIGVITALAQIPPFKVGDIELSGDIMPTTPDTYRIGSATESFKQIFTKDITASGTATFDTLVVEQSMTGGTITSAIVVEGDITSSGNITAATGTVTADSASITGNATAAFFFGDGSNLTNLTASTLQAVTDVGTTTTNTMCFLDGATQTICIKPEYEGGGSILGYDYASSTIITTILQAGRLSGAGASTAYFCIGDDCGNDVGTQIRLIGSEGILAVADSSDETVVVLASEASATIEIMQGIAIYEPGSGDIKGYWDANSGDLYASGTVSAATVTVGTTELSASYATATTYYGDGSNLSGISPLDTTKVLKAGDTMSGKLTVEADIITSGDITAATGTVTADIISGSAGSFATDSVTLDGMIIDLSNGSAIGDGLGITNAGAGDSLNVQTTGTGNAGSFEILNSQSVSDAVSINSNATGTAADALYIEHTGDGNGSALNILKSGTGGEGIYVSMTEVNTYGIRVVGSSNSNLSPLHVTGRGTVFTLNNTGTGNAMLAQENGAERFSISRNGSVKVTTDTTGTEAALTARNNEDPFTTDGNILSLQSQSIERVSVDITGLYESESSMILAGGMSAATSTWSGTSTHSADIMPATTDSYNLGSSDYRWAEGWFASSTLHVGNFDVTATGTGLAVNGPLILNTSSEQALVIGDGTDDRDFKIHFNGHDNQSSILWAHSEGSKGKFKMDCDLEVGGIHATEHIHTNMLVEEVEGLGILIDEDILIRDGSIEASGTISVDGGVFAATASITGNATADTFVASSTTGISIFKGDVIIEGTLTGGSLPTVLQFSEETIDTTTFITYQEAFRATTTLASGTYVVQYSAEVGQSDADKRASGRLQIDDTTTIAEIEPTAKKTNAFHSMSGVYFLSTSGATYHFDFDFSAPDGATTTIRRKRIIIMEVLE